LTEKPQAAPSEACWVMKSAGCWLVAFFASALFLVPAPAQVTMSDSDSALRDELRLSAAHNERAAIGLIPESNAIGVRLMRSLGQPAAKQFALGLTVAQIVKVQRRVVTPRVKNLLQQFAYSRRPRASKRRRPRFSTEHFRLVPSTLPVSDTLRARSSKCWRHRQPCVPRRSRTAQLRRRAARS